MAADVIDADGVTTRVITLPVVSRTWHKPVARTVWPTKADRKFGALRGERRHRGVDFFAPRGTDVLAVQDGMVTRAHKRYTRGFSGYGRVVVLRIDAGPYVLYSHLDDVYVSSGERVQRGQRIGTVGDTAFSATKPTARFRSSKPHLHFEVSPHPYPMARATERIDPRVFFGAKEVRLVKGKRVFRAPRAGAVWGVAVVAGVLLFMPKPKRKAAA